MKKSKLSIETPCEKRWADLDGEGRKRHCAACSLHVIDGSALTKEAAETAVSDAASVGERVCMRMLVDKSGDFVHAPSAPAQVAPSAWKAGAVFAAGALVACADDGPAPEVLPSTEERGAIETPTVEGPVTRPPEILGEICYVEEPSPGEPAPRENPAENTAEKSDESVGTPTDPQFPEPELLEMMGGMRMPPGPPPEESSEESSGEDSEA